MNQFDYPPFTAVNECSHAGEVRNPLRLNGDGEVLFGCDRQAGVRTPVLGNKVTAHDSDGVFKATCPLTMAAMLDEEGKRLCFWN